METIETLGYKIEQPCQSCAIHVGTEWAQIMQEIVREYQGISRFVLCLDHFVANVENFSSKAAHMLGKLAGGRQVILHILPEGKSRGVKEELENLLLEQKCHRDTLLIAVGGGSVLDLVGFVAAVYCRGIPWVAVPTTLLAMVDASIGGKTGIDVFPYAKNMLGAMWNPEHVWVDLAFLDTLEEQHWRQGWAEILKLAIVFDAKRFEQLENLGSYSWKTMWENNSAWIRDWITWSIQTKASVVTTDWRETSGKRCLLNFGHTVGHALENVAIGGDNVCRSHGDAVGYGMIIETEMLCSSALRDKELDATEGFRIIYLLEKFGWKKSDIASFVSKNITEILSSMGQDKKSSGKKARFVAITSIGEPFGLYPVDIYSNQVRSLLLNEISLCHGGTCDFVKEKTVIVPGSKSITNRALCLATILSVAGNESIILRNPGCAEDTMLMIEALKKLFPVTLSWTAAGIELQPLLSTSNREDIKSMAIVVGNAGTVIRFLIPICVFILSVLRPGLDCITLYGCSRMTHRPFSQIWKTLGCDIAESPCLEWHGSSDQTGSVPILSVYPGRWQRSESENILRYEAKGGSSQFLSGLLIALSGELYLISKQKASRSRAGYRIILDGIHAEDLHEMDSAPFVWMTIHIIREFFGPVIELIGPESTPDGLLLSIRVSNFEPSRPLTDYTIESDLTACSYPCTAAAISKSKIRIPCFLGDLQGDFQYLCLLTHFGCSLYRDGTDLCFSGGISSLSLDCRSCHPDHDRPCQLSAQPPVDLKDALVVDFSHIGDTFMTFIVWTVYLASFWKSPQISWIVLTGLAAQERKESKRVSIMYQILTKQLNMDALIDSEQRWIAISMNKPPSPLKLSVDPCQDHRIAMACSLLLYCVNEVVIQSRDCTGKTWPNYWSEMSRAFNWNES